jgi:hypothetical protein
MLPNAAEPLARKPLLSIFFVVVEDLHGHHEFPGYKCARGGKMHSSYLVTGPSSAIVDFLVFSLNL